MRTFLYSATRWLCVAMLIGGGVNAQAAEKVTYYYTDPQGTPLAEADAQGNVTATFDYRPFGSQAAGAPQGGPGYTGHVNDPDTGLVYMQARYYDPEVGRFSSVDPAPLDAASPAKFNRYGYANSNPYRFTDPDGRESVGEWIDTNAAASASSGDRAATYGWAFAGTAWNYLGAEGVSQVADKGFNAGLGNTAMAALELVTLGKSGTVARAGEQIAEQSATLTIKGFSGHAVDQAMNRGVKPGQILDAIKNPLKVSDVRVDSLGRSSQTVTGKTATVIVNPDKATIVTVYRTGTKKAEKLSEPQQ